MGARPCQTHILFGTFQRLRDKPADPIRKTISKSLATLSEPIPDSLWLDYPGFTTPESRHGFEACIAVPEGILATLQSAEPVDATLARVYGVHKTKEPSHRQAGDVVDAHVL